MSSGGGPEGSCAEQLTWVIEKCPGPPPQLSLFILADGIATLRLEVLTYYRDEVEARAFLEARARQWIAEHVVGRLP